MGRKQIAPALGCCFCCLFHCIASAPLPSGSPSLSYPCLLAWTLLCRAVLLSTTAVFCAATHFFPTGRPPPIVLRAPVFFSSPPPPTTVRHPAHIIKCSHSPDPASRSLPGVLPASIFRFPESRCGTTSRRVGKQLSHHRRTFSRSPPAACLDLATV